MTRKVFNYGGGMHSPTALTAFLRDALDGDVADGMKVVAGSGMNVTVQAGTARVGRDPSYDINVTGTESVDVGAASPSNPMNAVIVAYVDRSVAGSTSVTDNTNNVFKLKAVSGAAAPSPSDPSSSAIQSAIGAANPYIILARVRKRAGATSVIASDITDMRVMVTLKAGRINSSSMLADDIIKSGHLSDGIVLPRHIDWPRIMASKINTINGVPAAPMIQYGRARIDGNSNTEIAGQVSFPKSFKAGTVPMVICSYIGYTTKSSSWTDSPIGTWAGVSVAATEISSSGFKPRMRRFDGATLGDAYYVNWIAIGEA